jgi:hypothetical protein
MIKNFRATYPLLILAAAIGLSQIACSKKDSEQAKIPATSSGTQTETSYARPAGGGEALTPDLSVAPEPFDRAKLVPKNEGSASIGFVDHNYETPAGHYTGAQYTDYVLKNTKVALYFRAVDRFADDKSDFGPRKTLPGALIDVSIGATRTDFLAQFTQGVGTDLDLPLISYDYAEFINGIPEQTELTPDNVNRVMGPAVGLRLTGPLPDKSGRVETTYWLAPNESRVKIVTRPLNTEKPVVLADHIDWGAAGVVVDRHGPSPGGDGAQWDAQWFAGRAGTVAMGVTSFPSRMSGTFYGRLTRVETYAQAGDTRVPTNERWLYFGDKDFASVTDQIFVHASPEQPYGTYRGKLIALETNEPAPASQIRVLYYDRPTEIGDKLNLRYFTQAIADERGEFSLLLPTIYTNPDNGLLEGRYAVETVSRSRNFARANLGIVVRPGQITEREAYVSQAATLHVKLIDSKTKEPMPGRVRFEAIPPTLNSQFDSIDSAAGYVDSFYVPIGGREVELFAGKYVLHITGGIRYDHVQHEVELIFGAKTISEIEVPMTSPTPGWLGVEFGAMTRATPGATLSAEDIVLMCAGEGIDWVISGDWETITDLRPAIEKLGLQNRLNSSRGFRTHLPAHPEWGGFLIYPLAEDAPDPQKAKAEWKDLTEAKDFIKTLRRLYPGALIQSLNPYSLTDGYFFRLGSNPYEMAWEPRADIDTSIDAINLFEPRQVWDFKEQKNFYFVSTLRQAFYIPAPVSTTRVALGSEPGYPRLLVNVGQSDPSKVKEADLFAAMKQGKWQITTGPFIDYTVEGKSAGEMVSGIIAPNTKLRITAPNWSNTSTIDYCREGLMNIRTSSNVAGDTSLRRESEMVDKLIPQSKNDKDTQLNVSILGFGNTDPAIPSYGGRGVPNFAFTAPVYADTNNNQKWDPPNYRDKGK